MCPFTVRAISKTYALQLTFLNGMFPDVPGRKREGLSVPYKTESVLVCLSEVEVLYLLVSPYAATLLLGAIALLRSYIALLLDRFYS